MDLRDILHQATNSFLEDWDFNGEEEHEPVNIEDITKDKDVPAFIRKKYNEEEPRDEEDIDSDDERIPAFKRLPKRTDHTLADTRDVDTPIDRIKKIHPVIDPSDTEIPTFVRK